MTDTPPKPKRRRRRWLAVGMMLFVVSIAGAWYWRQPDQRFVGMWNTGYEVIDLPENGVVDSFRAYSDEETSLSVSPSAWRLRRGRFQLVNLMEQSLIGNLTTQIHALLDETYNLNLDAEIVEITGDHFVLRTDDQTCFFTRDLTHKRPHSVVCDGDDRECIAWPTKNAPSHWKSNETGHS